MVFGFLFFIFLVLNLPLVNFSAYIVNAFLQVIINISKISFLPLSKIYFRTPNVVEIFVFYVFILICNFLYSIKKRKKLNQSLLRVKHTLDAFKYYIKTNKKIYFKVIFVILFLLVFLLLMIPKNLKIHFVDVGQGDCTFIQTPTNKTILIDGGGSESGSFNVGKSTLIPYILDRGFTKIDYIFVSHFDTDHVRTDF